MFFYEEHRPTSCQHMDTLKKKTVYFKGSDLEKQLFGIMCISSYDQAGQAYTCSSAGRRNI